VGLALEDTKNSGQRDSYDFVRGELRGLRKGHEELNKLFEEHREGRTEDNKALVVAIYSLTNTCADLSGYIKNFNVKLDAGLIAYQKFSLLALAIMGFAFLGKESISAIRDWIL